MSKRGQVKSYVDIGEVLNRVFDPDSECLITDTSFAVGFKVSRVEVGSGIPVKLTPNPLAKRRYVECLNTSGVTMYVGDSTVTVGTGYPFYQGNAGKLYITDALDVYGIIPNGCDSGNVVNIIEFA